MKSPGIPEFIDPSKSCDKKLTYRGVVSVDKLPRYAAQQVDDADLSAVVSIELSFKRDEQHIKTAELRYSTVAMLVCQRCLGVLEYKVEGMVALAFSSDETELEQLPKHYEPVLMESNTVNLWQALEDELLLSLPMFANHEDQHCNSSLDKLKGNTAEQATEKPFAVLGELLKK